MLYDHVHASERQANVSWTAQAQVVRPPRPGTSLHLGHSSVICGEPPPPCRRRPTRVDPAPVPPYSATVASRFVQTIPRALQQLRISWRLPADHVCRLLVLRTAHARYMWLASPDTYSTVLEPEVLPVDGVLDPGELYRGPRISAVHGRAPPATLPGDSDRHRPGTPGILQVRQLRPPMIRDSRAPCIIRSLSTVRHHSADRDLVLHLSHDQLHRRLVSRGYQAHPESVRVRGVCVPVFPIDRWPHRSFRQMKPTSKRSGTRPHDGWLADTVLHYRLVEKVVIADNLAALVDPALATTQASRRSARGAQYWATRSSSISTFQAIARWPSSGISLRTPNSAEFQLPYKRSTLGLLASLAHLALELSAGLRLHSVRRQPKWRGQNVSQPDVDHADWRPVAWRELDVRRLGWLSRTAAGLPPPICGDLGSRAGVGSARKHVLPGRHRMGAVPRH